MRRIFLREPLTEQVTLTGSDAHHLGYALRADVGEHIIVADSERRVAEMEITGFTADTVSLRLVKELKADTESPLTLGLAMCLVKSDKFDFIVQKAVELGADFVQPLASENCVVKYDAKKMAARVERWQRIADEAAKQCGRTSLAEVRPIRPLAQWLQERNEAEIRFMCYEAERQQTIGDYLDGVQAECVTALVGPEGGFSPAEAALAESAGVAQVTLGPRILRAETAALAVLTVVQHLKGDLGERRTKA